jgi:hypothetical protein
LDCLGAGVILDDRGRFTPATIRSTAVLIESVVY